VPATAERVVTARSKSHTAAAGGPGKGTTV